MSSIEKVDVFNDHVFSHLVSALRRGNRAVWLLHMEMAGVA